MFSRLSLRPLDCPYFFACVFGVKIIEHRLLGKGKANRQKPSIHAGLRRDGSQKLTSQKTDHCTITYRF